MHCLLFGLTCLATLAGETTIDARTTGAVGDGTTKDTAALQRALDTCAEAGGGRVVLPPGRWLSGSLTLKSGVTLVIEPGATLLGSADINDFRGPLVGAEDAVGIGLSGGGTIDGQGERYWIPREQPYTGPEWRATAQFWYQPLRRPTFVRFTRCRDVTVRDLKLTGAPSWTLHLNRCEGALVERVTIRNPLHGPNTDGIDLNMCRRVTVRDCDIITGDDGVVLKSTDPGHDHPSADILVERCRIWSACNGLKLGTETHDRFERITFRDCHVYSATELMRERTLAGVALESVDGSHLSEILVDNITMDNVRAPLFVRLGHRGGNSERTRQVEPRVPGSIRGVVLRNITATRSGFESSITGLVDHPVEQVTLENVTLGYQGGGEADWVLADVPDREVIQRYPEAQMFGRLPAYGLYLRHVAGIRLRHVRFNLDQPDPRPALVADNVTGLLINGGGVQAAGEQWPVLWLLGVRDARIEDFALPAGLAGAIVSEGGEGVTAPGLVTQPRGALLRRDLPLLTERSPGLVVAPVTALKLIAPLAPVAEPEAAGGQAVAAPLGRRDSGSARARFTVSVAGEYKIWVRAFAPDGESDSFWATLDDDGPALTDVRPWGKWAWLAVHDRARPETVAGGKGYRLTAGEHLLHLGNREGGTRLDTVVIALDRPGFDPATAR